VDRNDAALTEALGQNEFQMRLAADMGLVCVPDLGWRRVLVRSAHVQGLHQPRQPDVPPFPVVVGLWLSPSLKKTLPVAFEVGQVVPFGSVAPE